MVQGEKAFDQQETALGIFLDKEGTFNSTSYDSMCVALAKHGVNYTIIQWIRTTLEGRLATEALGGFSRSIEVSRGCPWGGVFSPLLSHLVVGELIANSIGVEFILKDMRICLLMVGKFPNTISSLIQWAIHTVEMCDEPGL